MSKKDSKNVKENALEQLSKSLEFEAVSENEAGQLAGGFSDALSEDQLVSSATINVSKCHCGGGTTTQPQTSTTVLS